MASEIAGLREQVQELTQKNKDLEEEVLPQKKDIEAALRQLAQY